MIMRTLMSEYPPDFVLGLNLTSGEVILAFEEIIETRLAEKKAMDASQSESMLPPPSKKKLPFGTRPGAL